MVRWSGPVRLSQTSPIPRSPDGDKNMLLFQARSQGLIRFMHLLENVYFEWNTVSFVGIILGKNLFECLFRGICNYAWTCSQGGGQLSRSCYVVGPPQSRENHFPEQLLQFL